MKWPGTSTFPACRIRLRPVSTALFLLLRALVEDPDLADRREVVLLAYTCPAVAKVALDVGLRPRLVDISPATLGFDLDRLSEAIGRQTLAVMHVHPFGLPLSIEPVLDLARQAGAVVIEKRPNPWERVWQAVRWARAAILSCTAWDLESPCH